MEAGADVNAQDDAGETALSNAASSGHVDLVKLLLEAGADVGAEGSTAIIQAASSGLSYDPEGRSQRGEVVNLLIEAGADVNVKSGWGETALMNAATDGNPEVTRQLLKAGADVNAHIPGLASGWHVASLDRQLL